jgi:Arc/MetJ family transcription regulator
MRTTVTLDDELLASAREYVGDVDTPTLLRLALTALIQREAARRLAALGGSEPDFDIPERRRSAS